MVSQLDNYRVFIASPGGLDGERKIFRSVLQEYNEADANARGVHFSPVDWELTIGGVGRPQELINQDVRASDFMVLVLHDRWGSTTGRQGNSRFSSGTEEEFHEAVEALGDSKLPMKDIVLFFKAVDDRQLSDPGPQLKQVLAFRDQREKAKDLLYSNFDTPERFASILRRTLAAWLRRHEKGLRKKRLSSPVSDLDPDWSLRAVEDESELSVVRTPADWRAGLAVAKQHEKAGMLVDAELLYSQLAVAAESAAPLVQYGAFLRRIDQLDRAGRILEQGLRLAERTDEVDSSLQGEWEQGRVLEGKGDFRAAATHLRRALKIARATQDGSTVASLLKDLGLVLRRQGSIEKAIEALEGAVREFQRLGDEAGHADALGYLGLAFKTRGDLEEAKRSQQQALEIREKLRDSHGIAIVLGNLGVVYRMIGDPTRALRMHRRALGLFKENGDDRGMAREYSSIGASLRELGKLDEAERMHRKALRLSEVLNNSYSIAVQYSNLGRIQALSGKLAEAEVMFRKSLEISERIGDLAGRAIQYENLGRLRASQGDLQGSETLLTQSIELSREVDARFSLAGALQERGLVRLRLGREGEGQSDLEEAESLFEAMSLTESARKIREILAAPSKEQ